MAFTVHNELDVVEDKHPYNYLDHAQVGTKTGGGLLMATKQDNGAAGRSRKEAPSPNSRWRADLNTVLMGLITLLFSGLFLSIDGRIDSINDRIDDLSQRVETGFREVNDRFSRLEQRLDQSTQALQTMFLDHVHQHAGNPSAKDGIASALPDSADAEKLLTPELKAALDTLYFGNKAFSEYELRSKLIQYVRPSDILIAARQKIVPLYKIHLAMAAYYYHTRKKQP
jgi:hypothetical protein